jgi:hypothetical protein
VDAQSAGRLAAQAQATLQRGEALEGPFSSPPLTQLRRLTSTAWMKSIPSRRLRNSCRLDSGRIGTQLALLSSR